MTKNIGILKYRLKNPSEVRKKREEK